jgi:hypothetical protein
MNLGARVVAARRPTVVPLLLLGLGLLAACESAKSTATTTAASDSAAPQQQPGRFELERITTAVPYPRGLVFVDGKLCVLARGRSREFGGATGAIDDRAGTIFEVDPSVAEPATAAPASAAVRDNARVLAEPTSPPFVLFDRTASPPTRDRLTDRPYCALRFDAATHSFYLCGFSGIDGLESEKVNFTKNLSDMVMRYDLRTRQWYEVERHESAVGGLYPHHDPATCPPPHGWLDGPDNCLVVGRWLYCVAKDNSRLVRYDLGAVAHDAGAAPPPSEVVLEDAIPVEGLGTQHFYGHSALAAGDGWLYLAFRTSSEVVRLRLADDGTLARPLQAQLIARFDPWDAKSRKSANVTDLALDGAGRLYVLSAKPTRVYRFVPDPAHVFDARGDKANVAWLDLATLAGKPQLKSENILLDERGRLYVSSSDAYAATGESSSTVYRATPLEGSSRP